MEIQMEWKTLQKQDVPANRTDQMNYLFVINMENSHIEITRSRRPLIYYRHHFFINRFYVIRAGIGNKYNP